MRTTPGHHAEHAPDEAAELAGDGDDDLVAVLAARVEFHHAGVQPQLRLPTVGLELGAQALLARAEFLAHLGRQAVVVRGFDQEPAGVAVAGLGDAALAAALSAAAL